MAAAKRLDMTRLLTLVSVTILVGTELVGASWAAGWAIGGLAQLDRQTSFVIEAAFALAGFVGLYYFVRSALKHEPVYIDA
jgi:hypothetical protein